MWDHRLGTQKAVSDLNKAVANTMKQLISKDEQAQSLVIGQKWYQILLLILCRAVGILGSLMLLALGFAFIFLITQFQTELDSLPGGFMASILLSIINVAFPLGIRVCVAIERYRSVSFAERNIVARIYILKLVGLSLSFYFPSRRARAPLTMSFNDKRSRQTRFSSYTEPWS